MPTGVQGIPWSSTKAYTKSLPLEVSNARRMCLENSRADARGVERTAVLF